MNFPQAVRGCQWGKGGESSWRCIVGQLLLLGRLGLVAAAIPAGLVITVPDLCLRKTTGRGGTRGQDEREEGQGYQVELLHAFEWWAIAAQRWM